jgi:hypothetical protein
MSAIHGLEQLFGVQVPEKAAPGSYKGVVTFSAKGLEETPLDVTVTVANQAIAASGDDEPSRQSRLRWLDSTYAMDDELVAPYSAVKVAGNRVSVLGRNVVVGASGFPDAIESLFSQEIPRWPGPPARSSPGPSRCVWRAPTRPPRPGPRRVFTS